MLGIHVTPLSSKSKRCRTMSVKISLACVHFIRGPDGMFAAARVIEADGRPRDLRLVRDRQGELAGVTPQDGPRLPPPDLVPVRT
jgi:hypothetical protein